MNHEANCPHCKSLLRESIERAARSRYDKAAEACVEYCRMSAEGPDGSQWAKDCIAELDAAKAALEEVKRENH